MLSVLLLSWDLGSVSKASLKSIVVRSVLKAGFLQLSPSRNVYVMCVRRVLMECLGLKPC